MPPQARFQLTADEAQHLAASERLIADEIARSDGIIGFDRFMELALYAPGSGYYVSGARKFGKGGDFVTAPEISPLFGRCVARQCEQVLAGIGGGEILEFGAGTGAMAADILLELSLRDTLPQRYLILELSPELRERQRQTLAQRAPALLERVRWLDALPSSGLRGVVLGNELLDAMPVHRFRRSVEGLEELFVAHDGSGFVPRWAAIESAGLAAAISAIESRMGRLAAGYESEVNLRLGPWLDALGERLAAGAVLLIDYGYSGREYYHPERGMGTLICHFRHHAHDDPLVLAGLQDITANVDFSAVADAGRRAGLALAGYTTQAHFLMGCGLGELMGESDPNDVAAHLSRVQEVKRLTLPAEMGERFKAIALTRNVDLPLIGFSLRNLGDRL